MRARLHSFRGRFLTLVQSIYPGLVGGCLVEGVAAGAGAGGVRVVDGEALLLDRVDEIDDGAAEVRRGHPVHDHADTVEVDAACRRPGSARRRTAGSAGRSSRRAAPRSAAPGRRDPPARAGPTPCWTRQPRSASRPSWSWISMWSFSAHHPIPFEAVRRVNVALARRIPIVPHIRSGGPSAERAAFALRRPLGPPRARRGHDCPWRTPSPSLTPRPAAAARPRRRHPTASAAWTAPGDLPAPSDPDLVARVTRRQGRARRPGLHPRPSLPARRGHRSSPT